MKPYWEEEMYMQKWVNWKWQGIAKVKLRINYSRVLHINPRSSDTFVNMAYTMQRQGRPQEAWRYFTMAHTVDPTSTSALEGRALVNASNNNPFAAYLDITKAIVSFY
jgi:Tfp pilus assembly protein PilF